MADVTTHKTAATFMLAIDYSQSLATMVAAGNYNYAHRSITDENFPVGEGEPEIEAILVQLDCPSRGDKILTELERQGLRPATMPELLAFGPSTLTSSESSLLWPSAPFGRTRAAATRTLVISVGALATEGSVSVGSTAGGVRTTVSWPPAGSPLGSCDSLSFTCSLGPWSFNCSLDPSRPQVASFTFGCKQVA